VKAVLLSFALLATALPGQAAGTFLGYLEHTANVGEAESQFILSLTYWDGWDGSVRVGTAAARWCELAAELGDHRPSFVLGLLQRANHQVKADGTEALKWLNRAAEQGDDYARVILGEKLIEGDGVPADWPRGAEWIRKSAQAGFAPAQFRLGVIYLVGGRATPKDDVEALAWFIVAAEAGSKPAEEFRDVQTSLLGREIARLAIKRSRALLGKAKRTEDS
jgi:hypothetical protein